MALTKRALDGNVETMMLSILREGPNYGYALIEALNERAPDLLSFGEGTIYPVLHRMERKGLVETSWSIADSGRRRKYYRISTKGHTELSANLEEWKSLVTAMSLITREPGHA